MTIDIEELKRTANEATYPVPDDRLAKYAAAPSFATAGETRDMAREVMAGRARLLELEDRLARIPAASDLAIALRELRERRHSYAARHAKMVASQAAPDVIDSYAKTLAEVDAAIAAVERLVGR